MEELGRITSFLTRDIARREVTQKSAVSAVVGDLARKSAILKDFTASTTRDIVRAEAMRKSAVPATVGDLARKSAILKGFAASTTRDFVPLEAMRKSAVPATVGDTLRRINQINLQPVQEAIAEAGDHALPEEISSDEWASVEDIWQEVENAKPDDKLNALVDAVQQQSALLTNESSASAKRHRIMVILILLGYVVHIVLAIFAEFCSAQRPSQVVREIRTVVKELPVSDTELNDYRIIARKRVAVRQSRKRHSQQVGTVSAGQIVRLVERRKKWALIEWRNDEIGLDVQGWVKSKCLVRLRRRDE